MKAVIVWVVGLLLSVVTVANPPDAFAQENSPSELIGLLTEELRVTPEQATGGAGAIFSAAKNRLNSADFSKVASAVPGMSSLLKAAPSTGPVGSVGAGFADAAPLTSSFKTLGLSPAMIPKFVPIIKNFVSSKGGAEIGEILASALK